jgi:hypothetical protein
LRDTNDEVVCLPSYLTVLGYYAKFCFEKRGMKVTTTNKGAVKTIPAVAGVERSIPSWRSYCMYWKSHHPNMRVRNPTEDICSYYLVEMDTSRKLTLFFWRWDTSRKLTLFFWSLDARRTFVIDDSTTSNITIFEP